MTIEQRIKGLENERDLLWQEVRAQRERIARTWEASLAVITHPPGDVIIANGRTVEPANSGQANLGTAGKPFGVVYANSFTNPGGEVVATEITDQDGGANIKAARSATANMLLALDASAEFPLSVIPGGLDHGGLAGLGDDDHAQYFLLAGETTDARLYSGADLIVYSDAGATEKARIDGATGNITTAGTVDGVDIAGFNAAQFVVLVASGHVANERVLTASDGLDLTDGGAGAAVTLAVDVTDILGSGLVESSNNIDLDWGTPTISTIQPDDAANAGTSTNPARSDHTHAIVCAAPGANSVNLAASAEGSATSFARSDHTHNLDESITPTWAGTHAFGAGLSIGGGQGIAMADDTWIGIGAAAERIVFDAAGDVALMGCDVLVGTTTHTGGKLEVRATTEQLRLEYDAGNYASFAVSATGNLTIGPGGDLIFDPVGNDVLPNSNYDLNLGSMSKKYLTLHAAELWVETLVAQDTIATIGGRILVGPTTILTSDLGSGAGDTTIYVKHNEMADGDIAYLEVNDKVEYLKIVSAPGGAGPYSYTVERDKDGSGRNLWYAGDAVFNTGAAGDGFIDLYSVHGVKAAAEHGPTIVGNVRNSVTYNDWAEHWAIGNLDGIYGYSATTYGVALGKYGASENHLTIDSTNGIRFFEGTATVIAQWDGTTVTLGEVGASLSNIYITSGAIRLRTNTTTHAELTTAGTFWFGDTITTERIQWDTTNGLQIFNASNSAVIKFDTAGNADITGKLRMPGASSAIAIGATPPTAANAGTGIWIDRTGFFALSAGTYQVKIDATDGKLYAGGSNVVLDEDGVRIVSGTGSAFEYAHAYAFTSGGTDFSGLSSYVNSDIAYLDLKLDSAAITTGHARMHLLAEGEGGVDDITKIDIEADRIGDTSVRIRLTNAHAAHKIVLETDGGSIEMRETVYINDTSNANMGAGLTINQGTHDDEILALKSSDVAHGATTYTETNTYGVLRKVSSVSGGVNLRGFKDADGNNYRALALQGFLAENVNTTKTGAAQAIISLEGYQTSGTSMTDTVANGNVFAIRTRRGGAITTLFIVDEDGDVYRDGTSNTFDEHDDALMVCDLQHALAGAWNELLHYKRDILEKLGIIAVGDDDRVMVSQKRLDMLMLGAISQLSARLLSIEAENT